MPPIHCVSSWISGYPFDATLQIPRLNMQRILRNPRTVPFVAQHYLLARDDGRVRSNGQRDGHCGWAAAGGAHRFLSNRRKGEKDMLGESSRERLTPRPYCRGPYPPTECLRRD